MKPTTAVCVALALASSTLAADVLAANPTQLLSAYSAQAGAAPSVERGRGLFTATHGREWSCGSCHGEVPNGTGRHAATGKPIGALAPAANPERFTDEARAEKWFRRNCNDVLGRECSAAEKADVLAWLLTVKR